MSSMTRAATWPIVSLLVIGATHLLVEAIRPELHDVVTASVVMPIYLIVGGWIGFAVARAGGGFVGGLVAGALLGLLPVILQLVGFGVLLGRDSASVTTSAVFGFVGLLWGGSLGAGIAESTSSGPVMN